MAEFNQQRKKSLRYLVLAFLCGSGFFTMMFTKAVPVPLAVGVAILCMLGFVMSFNKGYVLWGQTSGGDDGRQDGQRSAERNSGTSISGKSEAGYRDHL